MPKILWLSPYSLHDLSSGAAIQCKCLLEGLKQRGFEVWACSSFIFESPNGTRRFNHLAQLLQSTKYQVFPFDENGIHYVYTYSHSTYESQLTLAESELFFATAMQTMDVFKPDFVMGFGTGMVSLACFAEAKRRGMYTIYPVLNGNHGHYAFPHSDLLITNSKANAELYFKRDRVRLLNIGECFIKDRVEVSEQQRHIAYGEYITFINPAFEKGLSIFAKIAQLCLKNYPKLKFLVVNSRGDFGANVAYLHEKGLVDEHPYHAGFFTNVSVCSCTSDMSQIYSLSKVLVVPSLWWESSGRVVTEALLNGIPVVSSKEGGLVEYGKGVTTTLAVPEHCKQDYLSLPSDGEIMPWIEAILQQYNSPNTVALANAAKSIDLNEPYQKLLEVLYPYIEERKAQSSTYNYSDYGRLNEALH